MSWYSYGYNTGTGTQNVSVTINYAQPACSRCHGQPDIQTDVGIFCRKCLDDRNRELAVANAQAWLQAVFAAAPADQRPKLYKTLAAIYHPDVGGDPVVMVALNNVREAFAAIAPR